MLLPALCEPSERGRDVGPQRADPVPEPFLEANVLGVPQPPVRVERRRVVRADVEDDMVAELEQPGGHRGGGRLGVAPAAELGLGQHVADDRDAARVRPITWVPAAATSRPLTRMPRYTPSAMAWGGSHDPNPSR